MKMIIIVIVFVGMTTMACSDKPSSVSNDNSTTSAPPALGIVEKYPGHSPSGFIGDRRLRPGHYIQMDVLATTRNFINIWLPELCSYKGLENIDSLPPDHTILNKNVFGSKIISPNGKILTVRKKEKHAQTTQPEHSAAGTRQGNRR